MRFVVRCPRCGDSMTRLRVDDEQIGRFLAWVCQRCDLLDPKRVGS